MKSNISYLPGSREQQLAMKMVKLGQLVRDDINRYLRYKDKNASADEQTLLKMKKCKNRVLSKLGKVINLQSESGKTDEEWEDILKQTLGKSRKIPIDSEKYKQLIEELLGVFRNDTSQTKVYYVQKFMEIIARVSPENISIPFNPS